MTPQAPGGDPGSSEGGYLTMRSFTETLAGGTKKLHTARALATGETGENPAHTTRGFFEYTYSYAEARIKLSQPVGATSAFWLYSRDLHCNASDPLRDPANAGIEVDIFEEWDTPDRVSHATHWDGYADAHQGDATGNTVLCPGSPCLGNFHTYGVLWTPTGYRFFIDGQETRFWPRGVSHHPEFLILSSGARHDVTTDFGPLGDPRNIEMVVDYVKFWQPALSDIADTTTRPNVAVSIPFTASSVASEQSPTLPGPRVADIVKGSSNVAVVANADRDHRHWCGSDPDADPSAGRDHHDPPDRQERPGPASGLRQQLARLNRIIALKDLGFTLREVADMIDGVTESGRRSTSAHAATARQPPARHTLPWSGNTA